MDSTQHQTAETTPMFWHTVARPDRSIAIPVWSSFLVVLPSGRDPSLPPRSSAPPLHEPAPAPTPTRLACSPKNQTTAISLQAQLAQPLAATYLRVVGVIRGVRCLRFVVD